MRAVPALLLRNVSLWTPVDEGSARAGRAQGELFHARRGALFCRDGVISAAGEEADVVRALGGRRGGGSAAVEELDCGGRCLIPGFVDPHTHLCFAGSREAEFLQRLQGAEYLQILERGGGILSTVRAVRAASIEELYTQTRERALTCLRHGTTRMEIKSGYGLDTRTELKQLEVIRKIGAETPLAVSATFLGAHAVPEEYRGDAEGYVELLVTEMIPAVRSSGLAVFCDVFCEAGVFTVEQSRRILAAGAAAGMAAKLHADEVHDTGGARLAAELGAVSADHLRAAAEENLRALAAAGVVGVVLPATTYSLRKTHAPARRMVELGLPVAIATDCNPGSSFTQSMPFVLGLAVLELGLSPAEALTAATLNAAYAMGAAERGGSLTAGKDADFILLDGETPGCLAYKAGVPPISGVYRRGIRVAGGEVRG
jgi:imidazolonepropionase